MLFKAGDENHPYRNFLGLGQDIAGGIFLVDFDFINHDPSNPIKVKGLNFNLTVEEFLGSFNGDLFNKAGEENSISVVGEAP